MNSYEHSESFDRLKGIREQVPGNLTSLQYLRTLDRFLWDALAPIHSDCPRLFTNYLAKIVAKQALKPGTKFTSDDRQKLPVHLFNVITAEDPKKAFGHARSMYINRGLLFGFLSLFTARTQRYKQLHSPFYEFDLETRKAEISKIESEMRVRPGASLYAVIQQVEFWAHKATGWKEAILEKYTRKALMQAKSAYADFNHVVKLDDVVQIYLTVVNRAIDRCDARQGVLTTFIDSWFKSARSAVADMAAAQQDPSYDALVEEHGDSISDLIGYVNPDHGSELMEHIAWTAKRIDPQGYIRAVLKIPEVVDEQSRSVLETFRLETA